MFSLKSLILTKVRTHTSKVSDHLLCQFFSPWVYFYFLQRCRNFQSEKEVKLESLAGPEAALQTKHLQTAFCPGGRDAIQMKSVLQEHFTKKQGKKEISSH